MCRLNVFLYFPTETRLDVEMSIAHVKVFMSTTDVVKCRDLVALSSALTEPV